MERVAVDMIEKQYEKAVLRSAIEEGFSRLKQSGRSRARAEEAQIRLQALTPRERDVLEGLVRGHPNKTIAYDLDISPRTVEIHRANLMSKLGVASLSEALRIAFAAGLDEQQAG
jgi:two-component system response regulator FixJ